MALLTIPTFRRSTRPFSKKATMPWPAAKKQLTIRLDEDVLDWLKRHGKGYQTRINRILRVVMESQSPRTAHRWNLRCLEGKHCRVEWCRRLGSPLLEGREVGHPAQAELGRGTLEFKRCFYSEKLPEIQNG